MLIVSSIRLMLDLSVLRVPRPCLYMLGSSSQPKCFACVNLAYTRCMWTLESITPDHHVVLRNNELSQWHTVRGEHFLEIIMRDHLIYYRRSKQIRCKNMINITCNQIVTWYGQYHHAPLISIFGAPWSSSSPAWHHDLHHHDLHHCVFMKSSRQRLLLLLWLTRLATK